jgi:uncharacterized protein (TIGR04255 family)
MTDSRRSVRTPEKLKKDAVAESLFEVRFTCRVLPEIAVGNLVTRGPWQKWSTLRLATADIPAPIRNNDPNLQFSPIFELRHDNRVVKVGERVFSYHALTPYPGWTAWKPELDSAIDTIFGALEGFTATRLGLRYLNALTPDHFVNDISDLHLEVSIATEPVRPPLNLNYQQTLTANHVAMMKLASREFIGNPVPAELTVLADVDVYTVPGFSSSDAAQTKAWLVEAHELAKVEFFKLFTAEHLDRLAPKEGSDGR